MPRRGAHERLHWAVERLRLRPEDNVLEIGCGNGSALELVCEQLAGGSALGVDRSPVAIERARSRLAARLDSGQVELRQTDLDSVELDAGAFDTAFAVNVNLFWTWPATAELTKLRAALRPGAALHLVWEPPDEAEVARIGSTVGAALDAAGFGVTIATATLGSQQAVVDVTGTVARQRARQG